MDRPTTPTFRTHAIILMLFAVLAVWLTLPQATLLGKAIAGGLIAKADAWQNIWHFWWMKYAVLHNQNPLFTDLLYFPQGLAFGSQTSCKTDQLLSLPLLLLTDPLTTYGVFAILHVALGGFFTYLLAFYVTRSLPASLLAGVGIALCPPILSRFLDGQLVGTSLDWIALYLLALVHATRKPAWHNGIWLAITVALVTYTNWYHAAFIALLTIMWFLYHLFIHTEGVARFAPTNGQSHTEGVAYSARMKSVARFAPTRQHVWHLIKPWVVALPILLLLVAPLMMSFVQGFAHAESVSTHWQHQASKFSVDLVDIFLPNAYHVWWGKSVYAYQSALHPKSANWVITPGYTLLILAMLGLWWRWKEARIWGLLACAFIIYSFGPELRIAGIETGIPMPFALLSQLPGFSLGHRLPTATNVALIPLAVASAYGAKALFAKVTSHSHHLMLYGVLIALLVFENVPQSKQLFYDDMPPFYHTLAHNQGAILHVPMQGAGVDGMSTSLRGQMIHEQPIVGGYIARPPAYPFKETPLLYQLGKLTCVASELTILNTAYSTNNHTRPTDYGIGTIILHPQQLLPHEATCARHILEEVLELQPTYETRTNVVYTVAGVPDLSFVFPDRSWYLEYQQGDMWRWMGAEGFLYLANREEQQQDYILRLEMESFQHARPMQLFLNQQQMATIEIQRPSRVYMLPLSVAKGQHEIRLVAPADADPATQRDISVVLKDVSIQRNDTYK